MLLHDKLRTAYRLARGLTGIDPQRSLSTIRGLPRFLRDLSEFRSADSKGPFKLRIEHLYPIVEDYYAEAGTASGHYFHQDLWAARRIYERRPARHVDIGSRIDGFVAHLLVFMDVDVVDVRPIHSEVKGLRFVQADATRLESIPDGAVESISSLHAVEHFGLGRYGDPIAPDAWREATQALARVLRPGGRLYFSVPIGSERLEFNAHRVFSPTTVLEAFRGLELASFAAVDDRGRFVPDCLPQQFAGARYACGLFEFTRTAT